MTARCLHCGKKKAKLPQYNPTFCSLRCGFFRGVCSTENEIWCEKHNQWFNWESKCYDCEKEVELAK